MKTNYIVEAHARQWGARHGGFHTHELYASTDDGMSGVFRFIYDCGSRNAPQNLKPTIRQYVSGVPRGSQINLLVVSHFDLDHVSGLKELADQLNQRQISVRRIVVPFLTPLEKIALIVAQVDSAAVESRIVV